MPLTNTHEALVLSLEQRLQEKGHSFIRKNLVYRNDRGRIIGEMDVCTIDHSNGVTYISYYEIKTGGIRDARRTARSQHYHYMNLYKGSPATKARFIFYHPDTGFKRWK